MNQSCKAGIEMIHAKFSTLFPAMLGMCLFVQSMKVSSEHQSEFQLETSQLEFTQFTEKTNLYWKKE